MHTNRFWELIAKQLTGEITPEEMQELRYLKGEDEFLPYNDALLQSVSAISFHSKEEITGANLHEKWNALQQKINTALPESEVKQAPPARYRPFLKYTAVAASVIFMVVITWKWVSSKPPEKNTSPNIVSTRNGSRSKIQMPDGSQVWLNAGSSLKYSNDTYGEVTREVELVGEAYFDVAKDAAHPFIIHTKVMDVKVIGTAFNIRAYPNEKQTETALIRGSVEVSFPGRPAEKLFLKPNEKITVANDVPEMTPDQNKNTKQATIQEPIIVLNTIHYEPSDSAVVETAWIRNKLIFRSKSFEELARDLERWYNVSIQFRDNNLTQRHLTGTFYNETIFEALDYLKLSSPFQYNFNKETNTVTLYR